MNARSLSSPLAPVLAAALALWATSPAHACSCAGIPEFEASVASAEAVFSGVVESVEPVGDDPHWSQFAVHFEVSAAWKGLTGETVTIFTSSSSASCGIDFQVGHAYLVYADAYSPLEPGTFSTMLCHRTHETFPGDPDVIRLGDPVVPAIPSTWGAVKATYR